MPAQNRSSATPAEQLETLIDKFDPANQSLFDDPNVVSLLATAESDATTPMRSSGRGTLVVRSISAKQRPRRKGAT